jgi:hypothetical protein
MARLTLARKIAAITLLVWKKGVRFDAEHLKQQAARVSVENPSISGFHLWRRSVGSSGALVRG